MLASRRRSVFGICSGWLVGAILRDLGAYECGRVSGSIRSVVSSFSPPVLILRERGGSIRESRPRRARDAPQSCALPHAAGQTAPKTAPKRAHGQNPWRKQRGEKWSHRFREERTPEYAAGAISAARRKGLRDAAKAECGGSLSRGGVSFHSGRSRRSTHLAARLSSCRSSREAASLPPFKGYGCTWRSGMLGLSRSCSRHCASATATTGAESELVRSRLHTTLTDVLQARLGLALG